MMKSLVAVLAAALTVTAISPALANPFADERMAVKTDDLDLASADGQARLNKRVSRATEAVCGKNMDRIHLSVAAKARDCRIATVADWQSRNQASLATITPTG